MKKHEAEFMAAYGEVLDAQFEALSAAAKEDPPELSEAFEERMAELFRSGPSRRAHSGLGKRILTAAAAVMLLAFLGFTFKGALMSVAGFFVEAFDDHVEITRPDVTKTSIEEEYALVPIPEGYEEIPQIRDDVTYDTWYSNAEGSTIILGQSCSDHGVRTVDNEHMTETDMEIDGLMVHIILSDDHAFAAWIENGYFFKLSYDSPVTMEQFSEWIASVKLK